MAIVNLIPDSEGSVQQWLSTGAFHWTEVDDPVGIPDESATRVYTGTAAREEAFNHVTSALLSGATISNVRVLARMQYSPTGLFPQALVNLGIRIGAVRYGQPISIILSSAYRDYYADWANDPSPPTPSPWTKADIDNLESSLLSVTAIQSVIECTQIYFIVTYTSLTPVAGKGLVSWTP